MRTKYNKQKLIKGLNISLGAGVPSLVKQLDGVLDAETSEKFENDNNSLIWLNVRNLLTDKQLAKAYKDLYNNISKVLCKEWKQRHRTLCVKRCEFKLLKTVYECSELANYSGKKVVVSYYEKDMREVAVFCNETRNLIGYGKPKSLTTA